MNLINGGRIPKKLQSRAGEWVPVPKVLFCYIEQSERNRSFAFSLRVLWPLSYFLGTRKIIAMFPYTMTGDRGTFEWTTPTLFRFGKKRAILTNMKKWPILARLLFRSMDIYIHIYLIFNILYSKDSQFSRVCREADRGEYSPKMSRIAKGFTNMNSINGSIDYLCTRFILVHDVAMFLHYNHHHYC